MERNRAPTKQHKRRYEHQKPILQCKIDNLANHLPLHRVLKHQRILNELRTGLDTRDNLLHVSGKGVSTGDLHTLKLLVISDNEDPVAVVQMHDCGCGNSCVNLLLLTVERSRNT